MYNNNPRYKHFHHEIFTAGDYEQFVSILKDKRKSFENTSTTKDYENGLWQTPDLCHDRWSWGKYRCGSDLFSTFEYIFHKFKKGIYVQIINNEVNIFLPFSNVEYTNEFTDSLKINLQKYKSFEDLYKYICQFEGREYHANKVSWYRNQWYCNNGLVRYEYPLKENDSGINMIYDMFICLCKERKVPDCEFFINKRDFPILNMNGYEPYTALVEENTDLYSYNQPNYLPIFSMTSKENFADIPIPTWEDWSRCSNQHDGRTFGKHHRVYPNQFFTDWLQKKRTAVFRGASTGLGVTIDTNPRFFFSLLSKNENKYWEDGTPYLDSAIVKWNIRPRKLNPSDHLDIPNPVELGIESGDEITSYDQSMYRYILHLPGHSCAYRLSLELGMGSVILLYPSEYQLWYFHLLRPFVHYIPLEKGMDKTEIFEKMEWCEQHPEEAMTIAKNALEFYQKYLSYDSVLDYLQTTLLKLHVRYDFKGTTYNDLTPHFNQIRRHISRHDNDAPLENKKEWKILTKTKHTTIYHDDKNEWIMKETMNHDLHHQYFVSNVLTQQVSMLCPNFMLSDKLHNNILYTKTVDIGKSFDKYLMSNEFRFIHFKSILVQVALSLSIAQKKVMFMHYDLSPWNIMLSKNTSTNLTYKFYDRTICLKNCKYVAKVIDYEYSNVVYNQEEMVHNISPFFFCEVSDMIGLMYHSFHIILKHQRLKHPEIEWIKNVLKEICKEVQWDTTLQNIKYYIHIEKKFSNLILNGEKRSHHKVHQTTLDRIIDIISFPYIHTINEANDWSFGNIHASSCCNEDTIERMTHVWTLQRMIEAHEQSFDIVPTMEEEVYIKSEKQRLKDIDIQINFSELPYIHHVSSIDTSSIRWYPFCNVQKLSFSVMNELNILYQIVYLHSKGYVSSEIYSQANHVLSSIFKHFSTFVYSHLLKESSRI